MYVCYVCDVALSFCKYSFTSSFLVVVKKIKNTTNVQRHKGKMKRLKNQKSETLFPRFFFCKL